MPTAAVPNFRASRNGFPFVNSWPSQPDLIIALPLGLRVPIGDASNGLCGGMVFAARDFYQAGIGPPRTAQPPSAATPLYRYIVSRLFDSFNLPGGVLRYYAWMNTPGGDRHLGSMTRRGLSWRTIRQQWPAIKADIDTGQPSPLGLTARSPDPRQLGRCHQALAYAYELAGNQLTLALYDPNTAPPGADGVRLTLDIGHPEDDTPMQHNLAIGDPIRGFFRTPYRFSDPAGLA
ncbi:MAG: hypothetical protein NVSMB32_14440 [Actinomycetota bacterium]